MDDSNFVEPRRVIYDPHPLISTPSPVRSPTKPAAPVVDGHGSAHKVGSLVERGTEDDSVGFSLADNHAGVRFRWRFFSLVHSRYLMFALH
jgi:hypothetical protein